ncbi:MAG: Asp-tRNA(Asn)/Glu-tRNA(Gln) amidotransferase subunit GatA [Chloroflexi bacterium]|jgi:aspartyl-tRNA(Asn)/glutamyl-tRNA(Gln) amidotransferase subunit A|nr:Asp-tRNA(Asn)/Glu-tRNA(Gln) amidotransferase subunit GatA [Chloroflexota bacterium]
MDLYSLTITQAHELLRQRKISSLELTQAVLERIREVDGQIGAYLTVTEGVALEQARQADERLRRGERVTPLTGIPFGVKDSIVTEGIRTTCGSRILEHYVPPYQATAVRRLLEAGAVLLGKHNLDEFSMGSSTENSAFFPTRNPWDLKRVPGGSSGGSAAAVAAGECFFALGGDTGGSIRLPAAFCNVVGLKPTYGRVSRYGLIALASSFDTIGPLTRTVEDAALVLQVIAGQDAHDATSLAQPVPDYAAQLQRPVKGLRLGLPREYFVPGMEAGVEAALQEAIRQFERLGMEIREVSLPHTPYALAVYYLILFAEASANLARFDGVRFGSAAQQAQTIPELYLETRGKGFGAEVKRRIMLGAYTLSAGYYDAYYLKAQRVRTLLRQDFERAFEVCDVLLTPVSPGVAFRLGEKTADPLAMYLSDVYLVATNPAGVPALALPCGFSEGLPVGMQLIARHGEEALLFQVGHAYQQVTEWHKMRPALGR